MCPRTLVDRKRKRFINAVDAVVRLHDLTDPSTEHTTPPCSAHIQINDVPRTLDPADFRQHGGMATVMMKLLVQGFA